jgi:predicted nuclease of predicted toxin-antitoxin system
VRVLLDTCVSGHARGALVSEGHDVEATGDWPVDPGDDAILASAFEDQRVLVTLDKDFGELAVVHGRPHAGILRLVDARADLQGLLCANALAKYGEELSRGAIVTVEPTRVRVRPPAEAP